jgi:hypothetical protein
MAPRRVRSASQTRVNVFGVIIGTTTAAATAVALPRLAAEARIVDLSYERYGY